MPHHVRLLRIRLVKAINNKKYFSDRSLWLFLLFGVCTHFGEFCVKRHVTLFCNYLRTHTRIFQWQKLLLSLSLFPSRRSYNGWLRCFCMRSIDIAIITVISQRKSIICADPFDIVLHDKHFEECFDALLVWFIKVQIFLLFFSCFGWFRYEFTNAW